MSSYTLCLIIAGSSPPSRNEANNVIQCYRTHEAVVGLYGYQVTITTPTCTYLESCPPVFCTTPSLSNSNVMLQFYNKHYNIATVTVHSCHSGTHMLGIHRFVLCSCPYFQRLIYTKTNQMVHFSCPLYRVCPYFRKSFQRDSTNRLIDNHSPW